MKLKLAEENHSIPWTMKNLESVLGNLKNNKSRDHDGYINEIFKNNVVGDNLKGTLSAKMLSKYVIKLQALINM